MSARPRNGAARQRAQDAAAIRERELAYQLALEGHRLHALNCSTCQTCAAFLRRYLDNHRAHARAEGRGLQCDCLLCLETSVFIVAEQP
jgi:hypothetical protein